MTAHVPMDEKKTSNGVGAELNRGVWHVTYICGDLESPNITRLDGLHRTGQVHVYQVAAFLKAV
jgi:hypothetical protein